MLIIGQCTPSETPPQRMSCAWPGCPCGGTYVAITRSVTACDEALSDHADAMPLGDELIGAISREVLRYA